MTAGPAGVWWVILAVKPATNKTNPSFAFVVGPLTVAAAQAKYGSGLNNGVNPPGGFATKAEADAAAAKFNQNPPSFGVDAPGVLNIPNLPNPFGFLSYLGEIGHWLGIFVSAVTDIHTWISLGWGLLGGLLLWLGIWWWFRSTEAGQRLAQTSMDVGMAAAK